MNDSNRKYTNTSLIIGIVITCCGLIGCNISNEESDNSTIISGSATSSDSSLTISKGKTPGKDVIISGTSGGLDASTVYSDNAEKNTPPVLTNFSQQCFWGSNSKGEYLPYVKIMHGFRKSSDGSDLVDIMIIFSRNFVDNSYGTNSIGWSPRRGHRFSDIYKSDHVELKLLDAKSNLAFHAKIDLLSASSKFKSGYGTLGVSGGDGVLFKGNESDIVAIATSSDDNLNKHNYVLLENSPKTDSLYRPNSLYPLWNFFVSYRLTMRVSAFGDAGFGKAMMASVHASPSKDANDTINVDEKKCPDSTEIRTGLPSDSEKMPSTPGGAYTPSVEG